MDISAKIKRIANEISEADAKTFYSHYDSVVDACIVLLAAARLKKHDGYKTIAKESYEWQLNNIDDDIAAETRVLEIAKSLPKPEPGLVKQLEDTIHDFKLRKKKDKRALDKLNAEEE